MSSEIEKNSKLPGYMMTTIQAIKHIAAGMPPLDAYEKAGEEFLGTPSVREKVCPMGAFIGLCDAGLIKNIKPGDYGWRRRDLLEQKRAKDSAQYAIRAVKHLIADPELAQLVMTDPTRAKGELYDWLGIGKTNSQMDIVVTLWFADLINR
jgi:hypothetical protein